MTGRGRGGFKSARPAHCGLAARAWRRPAASLDRTFTLALADLVVVMSMGRIEQIGKPAVIRTRPATEFVREFIGA